LWLRQGDEPVTIDARPSDAIALALRADCPIYVSEQVMQTAKLNTSGPPEGPTAEQLRGWLEGPERRGPGPLQDVAPFPESALELCSLGRTDHRNMRGSRRKLRSISKPLMQVQVALSC
jgi:hypothetical protein